mmetsp:Transcript_36285/g.104103  ORF Transcript_36285/g.104103 Transcript_36285/m.104103 type:complete len:231 (+) Transcript_36285:288-980(+)
MYRLALHCSSLPHLLHDKHHSICSDTLAPQPHVSQPGALHSPDPLDSNLVILFVVAHRVGIQERPCVDFVRVEEVERDRLDVPGLRHSTYNPDVPCVTLSTRKHSQAANRRGRKGSCLIPGRRNCCNDVPITLTPNNRNVLRNRLQGRCERHQRRYLVDLSGVASSVLSQCQRCVVARAAWEPCEGERSVVDRFQLDIGPKLVYFKPKDRFSSDFVWVGPALSSRLLNAV